MMYSKVTYNGVLAAAADLDRDNVVIHDMKLRAPRCDMVRPWRIADEPPAPELERSTGAETWNP
jgi:hypothetical protein